MCRSPMSMMTGSGGVVVQEQISDYGLLSDCQSAALVSRDGSIDWYSPQRFDASSVFARLLDPAAGYWSLAPRGTYTTERAYIPDSLVLETTFSTPTGRATVRDALALGPGERGHDLGLASPHVLLRVVTGGQGEVSFRSVLSARPDYGLLHPLIELHDGHAVIHDGASDLHLQAQAALHLDGSDLYADLTVRSGEAVGLALAFRETGDGERPPLINAQRTLEDTVEAWRSWGAMHHTYRGPYADAVHLGSLVLQGLTYQPTGAIIAAPTTSLPEVIGGSANWDYRYVWLRDLGMTLRALWTAGCPSQVDRFVTWVTRTLGNLTATTDHVQIMYTVLGQHIVAEHELDHLAGYRNHRPVRIGNGAWRQRQHDVLGEVVETIHMLRDHLAPLGEASRRLVVDLANRAATAWQETDSGMWEARGPEQHYLSAKVMCWVALDRALRLAPLLGDGLPLDRWQSERDAVHRTIVDRGWSERVGAYTGIIGSDTLDASALLMPLVGVLPARDPRMRSTIEVIARELANEDGDVRRWREEQNAFFLCSYWLVECFEMLGEHEKAVRMFERISSHANDLGLLSEMVSPRSGELVGNHPQAFSHMGLMNAAYRLGGVRDSSGCEQDER